MSVLSTLPALAATCLFIVTVALDSEPPHQRESSMVAQIVSTQPQATTVNNEQPFVWMVPRVAANLEGDIAPVLFVTNLEHDFPAWEAAPEPMVIAEPVRTPLPAISSTPLYALSEAEMRDVLTAAGWPVELHDAALRVAWCESNYRPAATGDHGLALGLFQIHIRSSWQGWWEAFGFDQTRYAEPVYNAQLAWRIYQYEQERGYPPFANWSCRP